MFPRLIEIGYALFNPAEHEPRCFHMSAVIYKGRPISISTNSLRTHPINVRYNPIFNHSGQNITDSKGSCSEFLACQKLKRISNVDFNKCILVNIRINRRGELANSHPCFSCQSLLRYFSFKNVYFTNDRGNFEVY